MMNDTGIKATLKQWGDAFNRWFTTDDGTKKSSVRSGGGDVGADFDAAWDWGDADCGGDGGCDGGGD